jgi:hypothetical protein
MAGGDVTLTNNARHAAKRKRSNLKSFYWRFLCFAIMYCYRREYHGDQGELTSLRIGENEQDIVDYRQEQSLSRASAPEKSRN